MGNYALPKYDMYRIWIRKQRDMGKDWETIKLGLGKNESDLIRFLQIQQDFNCWDIEVNEWKELVEIHINDEKNTKLVKYKYEQAMLKDTNQDSAVSVPEDEKSSWQLYRKHLLAQGFKKEVVDNIEDTTLKILRRLNNNTVNMEPVKGLVIGNVQSGKTANMAALMAMAADWGWNMFIVLSGTIENLRQQTQSRLINDLNKPGNINWRGLEHLSKKSTYGQRAQDLRFEEASADRHFTVCLKNAGRLRKLIEWLQADPNKQKQMKILVIDDEADQAGINTADITTSERKTINKLIVNLVEGKNSKGKHVKEKYRAMNYIGYTATPYANILNEADSESLYPRSFITTLTVSNEYFGPQQIFGADGMDYDGMNIVRTITEDELEDVKEIHDGESSEASESLKSSICWFLCGAAAMRLWGHKKPISMLVHTSQKQNHHGNVAEAIDQWVRSTSHAKLMDKCKAVWTEETNKFTFEDFREQYPDYGREDTDINRYPKFEEIKPEIEKLINIPVSHIKMDSDDELKYHEGIHLCIDNCSNSGVSEDGMFVRLAYPNSKNMPSSAPVFIVVGGATLARGLTIEGLISTFFLRSVGQADTLMQMGRWFGYRRGYELIPRIWVTAKTKEQFRFLSALDKELREEILYMDTMGISPSEYGPKVKNTPKCSFIRITAKNRMQSAKDTVMDYSGTFNQTTLFDNSKSVLSFNKSITEEFINSLGECDIKPENHKHFTNTLVWKDVNYDKIFNNLLCKFKFSNRNRVFNNMNSVREWIAKVTEEGKLKEWNVIVSGVGHANKDENNWKLETVSVNKVKRTRRLDNTDELFIDIGVLRAPKDLIADVDYDILDEETKEMYDKYKTIYSKEIRSKAGLDMTPQLIIYLIDKDSQTESRTRNNLDAVEDIVGICINVPGGRKGTSLAASVSIKMDQAIVNDDGDLEDN